MIISSDDIRKIKPIAENINDIKRIDPYIEEAEKLDILPSIGASLYKQLDDIILTTNDNISITNNLGERIEVTPKLYDELLNGCYYNSRHNCNELEYQEGLIKATAYLAYSRFIMQDSLNITAYGVVVKRGEFSDPASDTQIVRASKNAQSIGLAYLDQVIAYMINEKIICRAKPTTRYNTIKAIGR